MQDGEVHDGDDDLHDGDKGGDEHGAPLLDAPCDQHEGDAATDDALQIRGGIGGGGRMKLDRHHIQRSEQTIKD